MAKLVEMENKLRDEQKKRKLVEESLARAKDKICILRKTVEEDMVTQCEYALLEMENRQLFKKIRTLEGNDADTITEEEEEEEGKDADTITEEEEDFSDEKEEDSSDEEKDDDDAPYKPPSTP